MNGTCMFSDEYKLSIPHAHVTQSVHEQVPRVIEAVQKCGSTDVQVHVLLHAQVVYRPLTESSSNDTSTNHLIDVCMHALGNSTTPGLQFDFNLTPPVVRKREHAQADPPRPRPIPETGRNS